MSKRTIALIVLIVAVLLVLLLPIVDKTSDSTTVIADHSLGMIVHPLCFDQLDLTNNVDEMSLHTARDYHGLEIKDECSQEKLPTGKTNLLMKILE